MQQLRYQHLHSQDDLTEPSPEKENQDVHPWYSFLLFCSHTQIILLLILGSCLIFGPATITFFIGKDSCVAKQAGVDVSPNSNDPAGETLHCGNTTAEARENGCEFDLLTYVWLPARCIERETLTEFRDWVWSEERHFGSWPFFTDEFGLDRIPNERALSERAFLPTYSTQEEHMAHCIFLWLRLERTMQSSAAPNAPIFDIGLSHTEHCTKAMLNRLKPADASDTERPGAVLQVGFGSCSAAFN